MLNLDNGVLSRLPALEKEQVFEILASQSSGLSSQETIKRRQLYGKNQLPKPVNKSVWRQLFQQLVHFMAILLWIAGLLAFIAGMPQLGWATWAVILVNALFSFWQEYRADRALTKLADLLPRKVKVYRDGRLEVAPAEEVVLGDLILLESGDHIPADARLVEADDLFVDLSLLTGESVPAHRSAAPMADLGQSINQSANMLFAGTMVTAGRGIAVVYAIGHKTEFGKVTRLTASVSREKSALELQVERIVRIISCIALTMGSVVFGLAFWWIGLDIRESFLFGIGIIVANVPEGLLPTVSLSLAVGVQRMAKQNALVRRLSSVETLSAATIICTDKTGTITLNEQTVRKLWFLDCEIEVNGEGYEKQGDIHMPRAETKRQVELLLTIAAVCSEADITGDEKYRNRWKIVGDPTEGALLVAAARGGLDIDAVRAGFKRQQTVPFDSNRKMMSVVVSGNGDTVMGNSGQFVFVKGAPLEVLDCCRFTMHDAQVTPMTAEQRQKNIEANDRLAGTGHRVLALAYCEYLTDMDPLEYGLTFIGFVGMIDPPRPEVAEAVRLCQQAGISVTMITGDYGLTAAAIGRQIGLVGDGAKIVNGAELDKLDQEQLQALLLSQQPRIFARANPEHKLRIVEAYKAMGHTVAVTGDGVNDAPALRSAHIGIAMGRGGTDVAREVADIVLLDDNFATIVKAIEQGRAIYENIRKFVTYILASNVPELVPFIVMVFARIPPALTILQILAIDIGTDMLPALALGAEKPETGTMLQRPERYKRNLLDSSLMTRAYGFLGVIEAVLSLGAFFVVWFGAGYTLQEIQQFTPQILYHTAPYNVEQMYQHATTMALAAIIACQVGNLLVCRSEHQPFWQLSLQDNRLLLAGIGTELMITAGLIYLPFLSGIFLTQPLKASDWVLLALCPVILVLLEELRRYVARRFWID